MKSISDFLDLTPVQKKVLERFDREPVFYEHFYFTGGTLLKALGIVPRQSDDLDFFTFPDYDPEKLPEVIFRLKKILEELFGKENIAASQRGFIDRGTGTSFDFVDDYFPTLSPFGQFGNIRTSSLEDLGANKASALCARDEVKDVIDVAFLTKLKGWKLSDLVDLFDRRFQIGTVTEEKLVEEILNKRKLLPIRPDIFFQNPEESVRLVQGQLDYLLENTTL